MSTSPKTASELRDQISGAIKEIELLTTPRKAPGSNVSEPHLPEAVDAAYTHLVSAFNAIRDSLNDDRRLGTVRLAAARVFCSHIDGEEESHFRLQQRLRTSCSYIAELANLDAGKKRDGVRFNYLPWLKKMKVALEAGCKLDIENPARAAEVLGHIDRAGREMRETALRCAKNLTAAGVSSGDLNLIRYPLQERFGADLYSTIEDAMLVLGNPTYAERFLSCDDERLGDLNSWIAEAVGATENLPDAEVTPAGLGGGSP
jgi:hypothetical protein